MHVSTPTSWRGGEQQLAYLLEELDGKGIVQAVMTTRGSAMEQFCKDRNLPVETSGKRSSFDPAFAKALAKAAKTHQCNLIHVHDSHAHTFAVLAWVLFGCRVPVILSRRVDFPVRNSWFSRFKYNHQSIKRVLCVSDAIKAITAPSLQHPQLLETVHSGIDTSRFKPDVVEGRLRKEFNVPADVPLIGNVAALAPHKDYFTFIDTVAAFRVLGGKAVFLGIGDGPQGEEIKSYAKEKVGEDGIVFTGFRKDVPLILPELDIFLITSETEGLGTSILDAFACRVPVVATEAGGIPEIVMHERTGLTAPPKDAQRLAAHLERMLSDSAIGKRLVQGATEHLQDFTKQATAAKTLKVYQAVLSES